MPALNSRRTYADGQILFKADLDNFLNDIETLLNVTKLNDDNLQDSGITASAKLIDATITTGKLASQAVTTAKIAPLNITTPLLADLSVLTGKIADQNITTTKIADQNVTTAKIADANVTLPKINFVTDWGMQQFAASGTFTVPANCNIVFLYGCGGGGSGGAPSSGGGNKGGGGSGAPIDYYPVSVTPGASVTVTIGAGGAAVTSGAGNNGGNTQFGSVVFKGGQGGSADGATRVYGRSTSAYGGAFGEPGQGTIFYDGGSATANAGGGGAGPFGFGGNGNGGNGGTSAGGGGSQNFGGASGAGGAGYLFVYYPVLR